MPKDLKLFINEQNHNWLKVWRVFLNDKLVILLLLFLEVTQINLVWRQQWFVFCLFLRVLYPRIFGVLLSHQYLGNPCRYRLDRRGSVQNSLASCRGFWNLITWWLMRLFLEERLLILSSEGSGQLSSELWGAWFANGWFVSMWALFFSQLIPFWSCPFLALLKNFF